MGASSSCHRVGDVTILERLVSIGLAEPRATEHLRSGFVRVDGETIHGPDTEIRDGARLTLQPEAITEAI